MTVNFLVAVGGKQHDGEPSVAVFPFPDKAAAESFAERWVQESVDMCKVTGGYADAVQVVDLADPDTMDSLAEAEEYLTEMAEARADYE